MLFLLPSLSLARGWSTTDEDGVKWLVAPEGGSFFSLGVNTANGGADDEKAKKNMAYYWGRFYPSLEAWGAATQERLASWGFNTAGGWSEASGVMSMPIIPEIDLGRNSKLHWYDIFDPSMQDTADEIARVIVAGYKDNPRILGYFTDNEVGWWSAPLFLWHLERGWAFSSKRALWQLLYDTYEGRWDRLVKDFVPAEGFDSFERLKETGAALKLRPGGRGVRVIGAFTRMIAGRYYELAFRAMRKADPKALVVGDRLPLYYDQNAVLGQKGFVDVLSTNYNVDCEDGWVAPYYFEGLRELSGAPVLVSEYFFAADENRSGNLNNGHLMHVKTQEERVAGATAALRNFASFPNVAGVHWFQFADEPTGGRSDGEDFNMGLVDIHDQPYEGLTAAFADLNRRVPEIHAAARWTPKPDGELKTVILNGGPKSVTDGSLLDWKDKAGTRVLGFTAPKPYVPFGDVHLSWGPEGLHFFNIAQNYVDLSLLDYQGEYPLSETYQIRMTVDAGAGPVAVGVHLAPRPHRTWQGRYELVPQLWRYENGKPAQRIDETGLVQALDKPLPHIQVEGLIPAKLLGVDALKPGQDLSVSIEVTNFYRELTMASGSLSAVLGRAVDNAGAQK
ncbi:MAG: hypothetical protein ACOZEN_15335 [Thermodesulfobacteriota bacterium]